MRAGEAATVFGLALDDRDVAEVSVALQNLETQAWLRGDGSWGARELLAVEPARSGSSSVAWSLAWTPPAAGRYGVSVEVEDTAGKRATSRETREIVVE